MLAELQQEQDQKQAELKMKWAGKRSSETKHASTQCSSGVVLHIRTYILIALPRTYEDNMYLNL